MRDWVLIFLCFILLVLIIIEIVMRTPICVGMTYNFIRCQQIHLLMVAAYQV